jgi:hypothetical protein
MSKEERKSKYNLNVYEISDRVKDMPNFKSDKLHYVLLDESVLKRLDAIINVMEDVVEAIKDCKISGK